MGSSATLDSASLNPVERQVVDRFVADLHKQLGDRLVAVWLYGSRARGEEPGPDSDIDLIVVSREAEADRKVALDLSWDAAVAAGISPFSVSVQTFDPEWIEDRRQIKSFYIQEVDRDKIILHGVA